MDRELLERAKHPDLRVGHDILSPAVDAIDEPFALVSQPGPLEHVDQAIPARAATRIEVTSLEEQELQRLAAELPSVGYVVGIGGGMVMDTAKYLAWRSGARLLLAPSIVSVDASVTNTVAVRRRGTVEYDGFVVADAIVADLGLIATAPPRLNRAGVGDLLSIQTGRRDWALGAEAGRVAFDTAIDTAAAGVLERLYKMADDVAVVSEAALEHIIRAYVEVNALLLEVGHSGPEEGSEHYFGYATEATTRRSFVHGELIGLGTVLMSGLQGEGQARAASFLDRCSVEWRPERLDLGLDQLVEVLVDLPRFVRDAGLPYSIIDETPLDREAARKLLDSIPPAASDAATPGAQEEER